MAKDRLRVLKKEIQERKEVKIFSRFVVVGQDIFALEAFYRMQQLFPGQVKLLAERAFEPQDAQWFGPSNLRGESNRAWIAQHFPEIAASAPLRQSVFFKDQKFHRFGSRTKPEELILQEPFYTEPAFEFSVDQILSHLQSPDFLAVANDNLIMAKIIRLSPCTPDDLLERSRVEIHLADASTLKCEYLFWGTGAQNFVHFFQPKEQLSNEFLEWSESTGHALELKVQFKFKTAITEQSETLFIPQSYTHPWGHYIGEFKHLSDGSQVANFLSFIDSEHSDEENVGRCLRSLKRALEKIFPNFDGALSSEFITLKDKAPCLKIDDHMATSMKVLLPFLHLIGQEAPLLAANTPSDIFEDSTDGLSCAARALAAQAEINNAMSIID